MDPPSFLTVSNLDVIPSHSQDGVGISRFSVSDCDIVVRCDHSLLLLGRLPRRMVHCHAPRNDIQDRTLQIIKTVCKIIDFHASNGCKEVRA